MKKYRIHFYGRKIGSLGAHSDEVVREVEAPNLQAAKFAAYKTHEHIIGGVDAVRAQEITPDV